MPVKQPALVALMHSVQLISDATSAIPLQGAQTSDASTLCAGDLKWPSMQPSRSAQASESAATSAGHSRLSSALVQRYVAPAVALLIGRQGSHECAAQV